MPASYARVSPLVYACHRDDVVADMSSRTRNAGRLGWLALSVALGAACGAEGFLEPLAPTVLLLEFDSRVLEVRYTDADGFPVKNARCTFTTVGNPNGAYLDSRVSVTD